MNPTTLIELPEDVLDFLIEAGDGLESIFQQLDDDPTIVIDPDEDADWYFHVISDHAEAILRRIEAIQDQLMHRADE